MLVAKFPNLSSEGVLFSDSLKHFERVSEFFCHGNKDFAFLGDAASTQRPLSGIAN